MFAGNFAPRGWAFCQGQILSIAQNQALFSIIGTTYGGNGTTTFALPDLRTRAPVGAAPGSTTPVPGLTPVIVGEQGGAQNVTLTLNQIPQHTHAATFTPPTLAVSVEVANVAATAQTPDGNILAQAQQPGRTPVLVDAYAAPSAKTGVLGGVSLTASGGAVAVSVAGGGLPVSVQSPYLGMNYIIALEGIYPSRN